MRIAAVTGTNGKSTTIHYARQLLEMNGAQVWTVTNDGVRDPDGLFSRMFWCRQEGSIQNVLRMLSPAPDDIVLWEAYSSALSAGEWKGIGLDAAAFTSFGRDHLDLHHSLASYCAVKLSLFRECIDRGGRMIVHRHLPFVDQLEKLAKDNGSDLVLYEASDEQRKGDSFTLWDNLVCATHLTQALGGRVSKDLTITPVRTLNGRLQEVRNALGINIIVDYAHNPSGLEYALRYLRQRCTGKLIAVVGCGGDRDPGKRYPMGMCASALSDIVIVTDDNPRSESPSLIRESILQGCPNGWEVPSRQKALHKALQLSAIGDGVLVAGMGADLWPEGTSASQTTDHGHLTMLLREFQGRERRRS